MGKSGIWSSYRIDGKELVIALPHNPSCTGLGYASVKAARYAKNSSGQKQLSELKRRAGKQPVRKPGGGFRQKEIFFSDIFLVERSSRYIPISSWSSVGLSFNPAFWVPGQKGHGRTGVYSADPVKVPDAQFHPRLSYDRVLSENLKVMDATAIVLCRDNDIPLRVMNINQSGALMRLIQGEDIGSLVESGDWNDRWY